MKKTGIDVIMDKIYNPNHIFPDKKSFYEYLDGVGVDHSLFFQERGRNENEIATIWEGIGNIIAAVMKDGTVVLDHDGIFSLKGEIEKTAGLIASTLKGVDQIPKAILLDKGNTIEQTAQGNIKYQENTNEFVIDNGNGGIKFTIYDLKQFKEKLTYLGSDENQIRQLEQRWHKFLIDHVSNQSQLKIKKTVADGQTTVELGQ